MQRWVKGISAAVLAITLAGGLGTLVVRQFFALEWSDLETEYQLRKDHVARVSAGAFSVLEKSECEMASAKNPVPAPCFCAILVHGLGDQATTWKRVLARPPIDGWHWFAPDLPAHGRSGPPSEPQAFRVRKIAEALHTALTPRLDAARCARRVLVGNSAGGWVVGAMLGLNPGGTAGAPSVVYDGAVFLGATGVRGKTASSADSAASLLTTPTVESLKEFQRRAYFKPRELPESVWRQVAARAQRGHSARFVSAQTSDDELTPVNVNAGKNVLMQNRVETLFIWGQADRVIDKSAALQLYQTFATAVGEAHAHFVEIPECGHLPQKECPKPLAAALGPFLNQVGQRQ